MKGKRKRVEVDYNDMSDSECSGFDDSSDEDYQIATYVEDSGNINKHLEGKAQPLLALHSLQQKAQGRIYQGLRNVALIGSPQTNISNTDIGGSSAPNSSNTAAVVSKPSRQKKPTIIQVLENISQKASSRRP
ncbi:hypothetical protein Salat_0231900 [Sesamum alatum]|uniref:Uncharacterized protein n=1 Tax=Sesamum alatum TaxID=300844 RepID=A0AAE1Z055_9LAMI|nr:hypothetical protein Salat_0231900 [Sesamum alatum]